MEKVMRSSIRSDGMESVNSQLFRKRQLSQHGIESHKSELSGPFGGEDQVITNLVVIQKKIRAS